MGWCGVQIELENLFTKVTLDKLPVFLQRDTNRLGLGPQSGAVKRNRKKNAGGIDKKEKNENPSVHLLKAGKKNDISYIRVYNNPRKSCFWRNVVQNVCRQGVVQ